jgi:hypothetical protein
MHAMRRRDWVLPSLVSSVSSALVVVVIGPNYLQPLPIRTKITVALAGAILLAALVVYSRWRRLSERRQKG